MGPLDFLRGALRSFLLIASLVEARLRFLAIYILRAGRVPLWQRGLWLHASCARILRRLSISLTVMGSPQTSGLVVSNHLSYLDVLVFGALCGPRGDGRAASGCYIFVAKSEVRHWPLFGALARCGGTVFVERGRGAQAVEAAQAMERALSEGVPVLLFPEGTSTDGSSVLPFRSALFEPALRAGACVTPAAIRYRSDQSPEGQIAYWGKMVFAPHLFRTLCLRHLSTEIRFGEPVVFHDRKTAAEESRLQVTALRDREAQEAAQVRGKPSGGASWNQGDLTPVNVFCGSDRRSS
jgi:lyso-ornithine lipid O-acyltransferase